MPRGKEPVLFSRSENSAVFIEDFDGGLVDALLDELFERRKDQRLDLVAVGLVDALHAHREHRLAQVVGDARAGHALRRDRCRSAPCGAARRDCRRARARGC